jgi:Flp pilus assembly protein TadG
MMRSIARVFRGVARKFCGSDHGNVAMIFALALLPLLAAIGSAVDLSRAMVVKMRLGEALDAAGLAVGGTVGLSGPQMTARAQKFFYANYPDAELGTVTSLNVQTSGQNLVKVSGTARVDTSFMGLFGLNYIDVAVDVEVTRESKGLEIALVLDNTGSMADSGKMTALKGATNELIGILFGDENNPSHLKMALVPFSQTVRVDTTTFLNNSWMDTTGTNDTAQVNFSNNRYAFQVWTTMSNKSWGGCVEARPGGYEETDDAPVSGTPNTRFVPYFEPDGPDSSAYSGYTTYVSDGTTGNQDTRLKRYQKYSGQNKTDPNKDCNLQTILPLTNDKATIKSKVAGMVTTGNTHINLGASWGWRVLSPTAPYTEGSQYGDEDWQKAMVFMTDGVNTIPSNSTWHKSSYTAYNFLVRNGTNQVKADGVTPRATQLNSTTGGAAELELDDRTELTCDRVKAAGIRVYTILLMETAKRSKDLMEYCASPDETKNTAVKKCNGNADKLCYESPSSADLKAVFQAIALDLSNLRLSQ